MTPEERAIMYAAMAAYTEESSVIQDDTPEVPSLEGVGGGMIKIEVGKKNALVPTSAYTQLLEQRIRHLERKNKELIGNLNRLEYNINQLNNKLQQVERELDNKLDRLR
jgi:TolA-binding protein